MKKCILFTLTIILTTACTKVVDVKLKEAESRIVIEGLVTDTLPATVRLTRTVNFYHTGPFPAISGAIVTITDNTGIKDSLIEDTNNPGFYKGTLIGVTGRNYFMRVVAEGKEYISSCQLPTPPIVDSLRYVYKPANTFQQAGYFPVFYGKDPQDENNFYVINVYRNDTLVIEPGEIWATDDVGVKEAVNGLEIGILFKSQDVARVEMFTITQEVYKYYLGLAMQLQNDGGFFSTPPANAPGNISNGALGVFQASGMKSATVKMP